MLTLNSMDFYFKVKCIRNQEVLIYYIDQYVFGKVY